MNSAVLYKHPNMENAYSNFLDLVLDHMYVDKLTEMMIQLHPRDIVKLLESSDKLRALFDKNDTFCLGLFEKFMPDAYLPEGHEFGIFKDYADRLPVFYAIRAKLPTYTRTIDSWITMPEFGNEAYRTDFMSASECPSQHVMIAIDKADDKKLFEQDMEQYVVFVTYHVGGSITAYRTPNLYEAKKQQEIDVAENVDVLKRLSRDVSVIHTQDTCLIMDNSISENTLKYSVFIKKVIFKTETLKTFK